jgi:hypothetical protein
MGMESKAAAATSAEVKKTCICTSHGQFTSFYLHFILGPVQGSNTSDFYNTVKGSVCWILNGYDDGEVSSF